MHALRCQLGGMTRELIRERFGGGRMCSDDDLDALMQEDRVQHYIQNLLCQFAPGAGAAASSSSWGKRPSAAPASSASAASSAAAAASGGAGGSSAPSLNDATASGVSAMDIITGSGVERDEADEADMDEQINFLDHELELLQVQCGCGATAGGLPMGGVATLGEK